MKLMDWMKAQVGDSPSKPAKSSLKPVLLLPPYETILLSPQECGERIRQRGRTTLIPLATNTDSLYGHLSQVMLAVTDTQYSLQTAVAMRDILADPQLAKIVWDAKALFQFASRASVDMQGIVGDIRLAHYLLHPDRPDHSLAAIGKEYFGLIRAVTGIGLDCDIDGEAVAYACHVLQHSHQPLHSALAALGMLSLYEDIELPLTETLSLMEMNGVQLNAAVLKNLTDRLIPKVDSLTEEIYRHAGHPFNIGSTTKELPSVLYDELQLPQGRRNKSGHSTESKHLVKLQDKHPIISCLLAWRKLTKLISTYSGKLPSMLHPETGRLHCRFNQTVTKTGRLSSSGPNLQNIPVRSEEGREVRRGFIPHHPDWVILAADYSQIELRVLAHYSEDETLMQCFLSGEDLHAETARTLFGLEVDSAVEKDQRRLAKVVNFAIPYGTTYKGLAEQVGCTDDFAQWLQESYLSRFPKVARYMEDKAREARENGYVTTLYHRRRPIPGILSPNSHIREAAEREAINMPIQGTAADIMKIALVNVHRALRRQPELRVRLLLQVHDEVVVECHKDDIEAVAQLVKHNMEQVACLSVPLDVEVKVGPSWGDLIVLGVPSSDQIIAYDDEYQRTQLRRV